MKFIFLILFFMTSELRANPFLPALEMRQGASEFYFQQTPPFQYPFTQSSELNSLEVNIEKFAELLGSNKLSAYKELFKTFNYDQKLNLYAYDFAVGSEWEFLPHPIVKDVNSINSKEWVSEFNSTLQENEGIHSADFIQSINELTGSEAYAGNEVEVLKTPHNFNTILARLEKARHHAFMSSFIFQCDAGSSEVLELMQKKIEQGVSIYLLIDKVFTLADRKCVKELKSIGVKLALVGGPLKIFHEKMYVFDGEYAVVDGQNMTGVQTLSNGSNNLINDIGVGIQGPLVQVIAHRFISHWNKSKQVRMPEKITEFYDQKRIEAESFKSTTAHEGLCRLVTSNPGIKNRKILSLYLRYIRAANNYIFFNLIDQRFQTVSGNTMGVNFIKEVINVANKKNNIRVDMLSNHWKLPTEIKLPEPLTVKPTLLSFIMSEPGKLLMKMPHLQISTGRKKLIPLINDAKFNWWASAIYMHAKTMMVDNLATMIGSYNINSGSENFSYEQVVVCHDEKLAQEMQKSIVQDLLNSIPIPLK